MSGTVYGFIGTRNGVSIASTGSVPGDVLNATTYPDLASFMVAVQAQQQAVPAVSLPAYATSKLNAILAAGKTFNVAASGATPVNVLCDGTSATRADLAGLAVFGQLYPTQTQTWVDNNGVSTVLSGTEFLALATAALNWIGAGYAALGAAFAGISASPATITTTAQIDTALTSF